MSPHISGPAQWGLKTLMLHLKEIIITCLEKQTQELPSEYFFALVNQPKYPMQMLKIAQQNKNVLCTV